MTSSPGCGWRTSCKSPVRLSYLCCAGLDGDTHWDDDPAQCCEPHGELAHSAACAAVCEEPRQSRGASPGLASTELVADSLAQSNGRVWEEACTLASPRECTGELRRQAHGKEAHRQAHGEEAHSKGLAWSEQVAGSPGQ